MKSIVVVILALVVTSVFSTSGGLRRNPTRLFPKSTKKQHESHIEVHSPYRRLEGY